jgi:hypothetical protein
MNVWDELLERQVGVVTRTQALAAGFTPVSLARAIRRGELVRVHPRVYVTHNGPLTWLERAWAAVLWAEPAGLYGVSALRASEGPALHERDTSAIHLAVARGRHLTPPAGLVLHRTAHVPRRLHANLSPPRIRYEHSVLDVAESAPDDLDSVAVLADACGSRRTTATRLRAALEERPWARRRAWLQGVIDDIAGGTCSVLEHGYLTLVERPHGLPRGDRQVSDRICGRRMWRDVRYDRWGLLVELDGRIGHTNARDRDRDLARDLDAAVERDATTLRLGYGQVYGQGCRTAVQVGRLLNRLGWPGQTRRCPECGVRDEAA